MPLGLRRLRQAIGLAPDPLVLSDAETLIAGFGSSAYDEARTRAREARSGEVVDANRGPAHWDRVRCEIGTRTNRKPLSGYQ